VGDSFRLNSFFENYYISIPNFRASFFISEDYVLFLTKNGLGNSLGDFSKKLIRSHCLKVNRTFSAFHSYVSIIEKSHVEQKRSVFLSWHSDQIGRNFVIWEKLFCRHWSQTYLKYKTSFESPKISKLRLTIVFKKNLE
jgi:hypothetical protein